MSSPQQQSPLPFWPSKAGPMVAVIIISFVLVAILVGLSSEGPQRMGSDVTLKINVYSTSPTYSVTYGLYVDNSLASYGRLDQSSSIQCNYHYYWSSNDPTVAHVYVKSTMEPSGVLFHYANLTVSDGGTYNVNLII